VGIGNGELAISPDGKNGYLINSFYDDTEREGGDVWIYDRNPATGSLVQKQGTAGCIAQGRLKGCVRGRALRSGHSVAISPDGRNLYASTEESIAIFDRDPTTGELTQPAGAAGCITSSREEYLSCSRGKGLGGFGIAISPDGLNVYVGSHPVTVFDRDPATGALTQKTVSEGTKSVAGDVIVSPDGKNVYVSTYEPDRLISFDRDPATGALNRVPGRAGCISEKGNGGCRRGREFSVFDLSISPDGRNVYGATSHGPGQGDYGAVTILDRLPDGTLAQKKGRAGCIAMFGGEGEGCARTESLGEADDITVSADGKRVYVYFFFARSAAVFFRDPSGRLTEDSGN
jgi:DNA-binding beta-propeller fold protein YncE